MFKTKQQFYIYDYIDTNVFTDGIITSLEISVPVFNLSDPIQTDNSGIGFIAEIPNGIKFISSKHLRVAEEWLLAEEYDIDGMLKMILSNGLNSNQTELVYEKIIENFLDKEAMLLPEYNFYVYDTLVGLNRDLGRIKWQSRGKNNV
jgi:hypothetical protein